MSRYTNTNNILVYLIIHHIILHFILCCFVICRFCLNHYAIVITIIKEIRIPTIICPFFRYKSIKRRYGIFFL